MEVKINKEIRNYTESMFFGLSLRQFLFSVLACGVAVGLFFSCSLGRSGRKQSAGCAYQGLRPLP